MPEDLTEEELERIDDCDWNAIVFVETPSRLELGFMYGRRSFETVDNDAGPNTFSVQYD